jgi:hypothetical protein
MGTYGAPGTGAYPAVARRPAQPRGPSSAGRTILIWALVGGAPPLVVGLPAVLLYSLLIGGMAGDGGLSMYVLSAGLLAVTACACAGAILLALVGLAAVLGARRLPSLDDPRRKRGLATVLVGWFLVWLVVFTAGATYFPLVLDLPRLVESGAAVACLLTVGAWITWRRWRNGPSS